MLNTIKTWFAKEVTTVETIMSGWLNQVKVLENHVVSQAETIATQNVVVKDAQAVIEFATTEVAKAEATIAKLKTIFG